MAIAPDAPIKQQAWVQEVTNSFASFSAFLFLVYHFAKANLSAHTIREWFIEQFIVSRRNAVCINGFNCQPPVLVSPKERGIVRRERVSAFMDAEGKLFLSLSLFSYFVYRQNRISHVPVRFYKFIHDNHRIHLQPRFALLFIVQLSNIIRCQSVRENTLTHRDNVRDSVHTLSYRDNIEDELENHVSNETKIRVTHRWAQIVSLAFTPFLYSHKVMIKFQPSYAKMSNFPAI